MQEALEGGFDNLFSRITTAPDAVSRELAVNALYTYIEARQIVPLLPEGIYFGPPPVCTARWSRLDWLHFAIGFPTTKEELNHAML